MYNVEERDWRVVRGNIDKTSWSRYALNRWERATEH